LLTTQKRHKVTKSSRLQNNISIKQFKENIGIMPQDTRWGKVGFNISSHGYLLAGVKNDLLDIYNNPEKYKALYKDKNGNPIGFKDISCQSYRMHMKNDALQPFTANTFGPHFKRLRDKIGKKSLTMT
jgi:hypothetical protein